MRVFFLVIFAVLPFFAAPFLAFEFFSFEGRDGASLPKQLLLAALFGLILGLFFVAAGRYMTTSTRWVAAVFLGISSFFFQADELLTAGPFEGGIVIGLMILYVLIATLISYYRHQNDNLAVMPRPLDAIIAWPLAAAIYLITNWAPLERYNSGDPGFSLEALALMNCVLIALILTFRGKRPDGALQ